MTAIIDTLPRQLRDAVLPLTGSPRDYDGLMSLVGNARVVLLGESTHGTHEFYRERAQITKRLIREKHFNAVAVEADWPDACRVNRYIRDTGTDEDAVDALGGFRRFPQWLWRNADVLDFIGWMRAHNDAQPAEDRKVGFHGLDLYGLHTSIGAVLAYLGKVDPEGAKRARRRYGCFDHFRKDTQSYGLSAGLGLAPSCEQEVVSQLVELQANRAAYLQRGQPATPDGHFCAEENARVIRNAEEYYRTLFRREFSSWNLRDTHMFEALTALIEHLDRHRPPARVVVWAHNSHLGDARATDMIRRGELNLGQLLRHRFGSDVRSIGLTTHAGMVTAAADWDEPAGRKRIRAALPGSYEALFHETGHDRFWLSFADSPQVARELREPRLERAIGVIYRPESERLSHYFNARLPDQFDAILHFDYTRAVEPLERTVEWEIGEVEETFPTGF